MTNFWRIWINWGDFKAPLTSGSGQFPIATKLLDPDYHFDPSAFRFKFDMNKERDDREIGGFAQWAYPTLFMSEKAFGLLKPFISDKEEVYPVRCGNLDYRIIIIRSECDAIDLKESSLGFWDPEVADGRLDKIKEVNALKLKKEFDSPLHLFRLAGQFVVRQQIIFSDSLKNACDENGLTGLRFFPT